jgi:hypothetical protein
MDQPTRPNLDWEYLTQVSKKTKVLLWSHVQPFTKNGGQCLIYLLQPIWTRSVVVKHLPTHIPFVMFNNANGGKEKDVHYVGPHSIGTCMNSLTFKLPHLNIGNTINIMLVIGHKLGVQT